MAISQADGYAEPELEHYCRACSHMTYLVKDACAWCGSKEVGVGGGFSWLKSKHEKRAEVGRPLVEADEQDVYLRINSSVGMRLQNGFRLMRGIQ